jgi:hypothetical protein
MGTRTSQDALLLDQAIPMVAEAMNNEVVGFKLATRKKEKWQGRKLIFDVKESLGGGVAARAETQGLPEASEPKHVNGEVYYKKIYGSGKITDDLIESSRGDGAAFKSALADALESPSMRIKKLANAYFYGHGNAVLATVATGGGGTLAAAVDSTLQITVDSTRYLSEGDAVALWTTAALDSTVLAHGGQTNETGTVDCERVIVSTIDSETQCTLKRTRAAANDATVVAGNAVRMYGDKLAAVTTGTNAPMGIRGFADNGTLVATLQGIARADHPKWKGTVLTATGQDLNRGHFIRLAHRTRRRSGIDIDTFIMDAVQERAYLEIANPDIRHQPVKDYDVGYRGPLHISIGSREVPLTIDFDCPYDKIFAFPKSKLRWAVLSDLELDKKGGGELKQYNPFGAASDGDVYSFFFSMKGNWWTQFPWCFGVIEGLNYSAEI